MNKQNELILQARKILQTNMEMMSAILNEPLSLRNYELPNSSNYIPTNPVDGYIYKSKTLMDKTLENILVQIAKKLLPTAIYNLTQLFYRKRFPIRERWSYKVVKEGE